MASIVFYIPYLKFVLIIIDKQKTFASQHYFTVLQLFYALISPRVSFIDLVLLKINFIVALPSNTILTLHTYISLSASFLAPPVTSLPNSFAYLHSFNSQIKLSSRFSPRRSPTQSSIHQSPSFLISLLTWSRTHVCSRSSLSAPKNRQLRSRKLFFPT